MRLAVLTIIFSFLLSFTAFAKPPASAFGELPKVYDAAISPDGSKIAAFAAIDEGYGIGIYYIDGSGKAPSAIGMGKGIKPQEIKWANNDVVLANVWQSQMYNTTPITSGFIFTYDVKKKKGGILIDPSEAGENQMGSRLAKTGLSLIHI